MNSGICQRYLETSIYTYVGVYKDFIRSLPDDIPSMPAMRKLLGVGTPAAVVNRIDRKSVV